MRTDHYAYQRGTRVAGFGLMVQSIIGLTLLLYGLIGGDTTFTFASIYVLAGLLVWVSLIIIFHQHKLERLEALEEDELSTAKPETSIFETNPDEQRVAARRLAMMHKWLMPSVSLALALFLGLMAWWQWSYIRRLDDALPERRTEFLFTTQVGWGLAICLGFALVAFIFSRFVAGMAKQDAWQNLRGGAGYMVGNAVIVLAVAVGMAFRVFGNDEVIGFIARTIPWYMIVVAAEVVLNFILNLYRPRIPGEVPRPAFDSRVLSLLAAPDSIVKSLNDAVNYQFGFDITSSWGYQLLLRSFVWLIGIGVVTVVLLNTMVVVEPHQQAVKLRFGQIVGDVHGSGIMWKRPWPFETARVYPVGTVHKVDLTAHRMEPQRAHLWNEQPRWNVDNDPFIVGSTIYTDSGDDSVFQFIFSEESRGSDAIDDNDVNIELYLDHDDPPVEDLGEAAESLDQVLPELQLIASQLDHVDEATAAVSRAFALADTEMSLYYRIRPANPVTGDRGGLLEYLNFVPDTPTRFEGVATTSRAKAIRVIALREITQHISLVPLDDLLSQTHGSVPDELRDRVQRAMDRAQAGIEVLAVNLTLIRPRGETAETFEEVGGAYQARRTIVARKQGEVSESVTRLLGDPIMAERIVDALDELDRLEREHGPQSSEAIEQRLAVERMMRRSGGLAATMITNAETQRWVNLMAKRAQATRTQSQILPYRASPLLYRERQIMRTLARHLGPMRKYIITIDPSRINIDTDLKELSPLVDFSAAMPDSEGGSN